MGESLAIQAQEKAMLKMESMQMKQELMMAQQEIQNLKSKRWLRRNQQTTLNIKLTDFKSLL